MATRRPGAHALPAVTGALLVAVLTACTAGTPGRASGDPATGSVPSATASGTASTPAPGGPTGQVPATTLPPTATPPPAPTSPRARAKPIPGRLVTAVGRIEVGPRRRCILLRAAAATYQLVGPYAGELVPGLSVEVVGTLDRSVPAACGSAVPLRVLRLRPAP